MSEILLATINAKWVHPSFALRLLRANLGELEERSSLLEFALRQPLEEMVDAVLAARPRILGLSVSIWNHIATIDLLDALGARWAAGEGAGRPIVILGGPEAANLPEDAPLLVKADWLVRGEGEHAFRELCASLLGGKEPAIGEHIASIRFFGSLGIVDATAVDLTTIDPGYRLYTDEDLSRRLTYVEASRGCPFGCEFCLSCLDRRVRDFPLEGFLSEMERLFRRGARAFKFLDRTFNLEIARSRTIMEFFLGRLQGGSYVHFEMVPSRFPIELRDTLARFHKGSLRLEVGIQTLESAVAAAVGRQSNPEGELEALDFLRRRTTAIVHADLIAGLPGETFASFGRGFDRLWSVRPTEIQVGVLKRLPGAPIARHDRPFGMRYAEEPPYEVISTSSMNRSELDMIKNFARFWELIVNRGHFDELVPVLLPEGEPVFHRFMALAETLRGRFGRNWGIERAALRAALNEEIARVGRPSAAIPGK